MYTLRQRAMAALRCRSTSTRGFLVPGFVWRTHAVETPPLTKQTNKRYAYVFRHVQDGQHEEDVLLSVLQLFVLKVAVDLGVAQRELAGQVLEVGGDVGPGLRLPLEPQAPTRPVDLLQQLENTMTN